MRLVLGFLWVSLDFLHTTLVVLGTDSIDAIRCTTSQKLRMSVILSKVGACLVVRGFSKSHNHVSPDLIFIYDYFYPILIEHDKYILLSSFVVTLLSNHGSFQFAR